MLPHRTSASKHTSGFREGISPRPLLRTLGLFLLSLTTIGCTPELRASGKYVDFYADEPLLVCAGTTTGIDNFLDNLFDAGMSPPHKDWRLNYVLHGDLSLASNNMAEAQIRDRCHLPNGACYLPWKNQVQSSSVFQTHEIVHAVQHSATKSLSYYFLSESIADSYQPVDAPIALPATPGQTHAGILRGDRVKHDELIDATGTLFATYLASAHGLERYWALVKSIKDSGKLTSQKIDAVFEDVYGTSLAELMAEQWNAIRRLPPALTAEFFAPAGHCGPHTPRLELIREPLSLPRLASCDDKLVQGVVDSDAILHAQGYLVVHVAQLPDDPVYDEADVSTWPARLIYRDPAEDGSDVSRTYVTWPCDTYMRSGS